MDDDYIAYKNYIDRISTASIYVPLLTGTLSVIGSGSILYSIWASRSTKVKDPQHRILGMMSIFDMLYSMNEALNFLTFPSGLGVPTFGNDATCSLQGFFNQFGVAAVSYNMVLSIYYYLSINRGMKKEEFAKLWEKVMHGIVITCHLSFAITNVSIGLIYPGSGYCYICSGGICWYFMFAFCLSWIMLAFVVIIVTNTLILICLFVRRQEKAMEKYRTRSVAAEQLSDMEQKSSYARSVFVQSMLYVGSFVLSWMPLTCGFLAVYRPWMPLVVATLNPLQGFWNAFIYARPRYLRLKKKNKHMGFKQVIKLTFSPSNGDSTGPPPSAGKPKKDSNVFRSFWSRSLKRKKTSASYPAVLETEEAKEETVTRSDSKPIHDADEETGKVGFVLPSEEEKNEEEEKVEVEEGDEFIDSPSPSSLPSSPAVFHHLQQECNPWGGPINAKIEERNVNLDYKQHLALINLFI